MGLVSTQKCHQKVLRKGHLPSDEHSRQGKSHFWQNSRCFPTSALPLSQWMANVSMGINECRSYHIPANGKADCFPHVRGNKEVLTTCLSQETAPVEEQGLALGYGFRNTSCLVVINMGCSSPDGAGRHGRNHTPATDKFD